MAHQRKRREGETDEQYAARLERISACDKRYRDSHREERRAADRQDMRARLASIREKNRRWREANPNYERERSQRRRDMSKAAPDHHTCGGPCFGDPPCGAEWLGRVCSRPVGHGEQHGSHAPDGHLTACWNIEGGTVEHGTHPSASSKEPEAG